MHVVAIAASVCLGFARSFGSTPPPGTTTGAPPASLVTTDPGAADLARMLHTALGRELKTLPPVERIEAAALAKVVAADLEAAAIAGGASAEDAAGLVKAGALALAMQATRLVAYYSHQTKKVYLQPAAIEMLVKAGAIPEGERDRVIALSVAHELMHAIQDQEIGLVTFITLPKSPASAADIDRLSARRAVAEGQAALAAELVGAELLKRDATWKSAIEASRKIAPGALDSSGDPQRGREALIYRGGESFMRKRLEKGGADATWDAFTSPPATLSAIESATLAFDEARAKEVAAALDRFGAGLPAPWKAKAQSASPSIGLASQLSTLPKESREQFIADCKALAVLSGATPAAARLAVAVVEGVDDEAAARLDQTLAEMQRTAMKAIGLTQPDQLTKRLGDLRLDVLREDLNAKGTPLVGGFVHARKGRWVLQLTSLNGGHDLKALEALALQAIEALEAIGKRDVTK